jgi:vacuolar-type H+-ATPase subunit E/Vma4
MNGKRRIDKIEERIRNLPQPATEEDLNSALAKLLPDLLRHCGPEAAENILARIISRSAAVAFVAELIGDTNEGLDKLREALLDRLNSSHKSDVSGIVDTLPKASRTRLQEIVTRTRTGDTGLHRVSELTEQDRAFLNEIFPNYYAF